MTGITQTVGFLQTFADRHPLEATIVMTVALAMGMAVAEVWLVVRTRKP